MGQQTHRLYYFCGFIALTPAAPFAEADQALLQSYKEEIEPIFDNYCYDCHGYGSSKGGVTLDEFTAESIADYDLWMRVLRNTRAHIMPPIDEVDGHLPYPDERASILEWVKRSPFGIDPERIDPGHLTVQRLNRNEYQNTIRDLMGIKFDTLDAFPTDNSGEGFDNIGELLTLSPMMLEKYLDAANTIVAEAVPLKARILPVHKLDGQELVALFSPAEIEDDKSRDRLELTFYEPSSRKGSYRIKKPGQYRLDIKLRPVSFSSFSGFDYNRARMVFKIDGETRIDQEFEFVNGKSYSFSYEYDWQPGEHTFEVEVAPTHQEEERPKNLKMRIDHIHVVGPLSPEHWVVPENYRRFFQDGVPENEAARPAYVRRILKRFAAQAYRRPIDAPTLDRLVAIATHGSDRQNFSWETGISQAMIAILASPRFLFREENHIPAASDGEHPYIDEYSLASRLSYYLWSSMPDQRLFDLASKGQLRENLDSEIERMMEDRKFQTFIENFAGQWLHARDIESVNISRIDVHLRDQPNPEFLKARREYAKVRAIPRSRRTPEEQATYERTRPILLSLYRKDLPDLKWRQQNAMREETEEYFGHVIRENRPVSELLDSDYTFLNETLAEHYGIEGVEGKKLRKVTLPEDSPRGGVLTHGTLLAYTSNPTRTSPVKRGVFILENILGTPPAAPPPNIPSLEDVADPQELDKLSLRDTLALHREKPLCASCHNRMDPLGLAFENFNAMGIWRDAELGQTIDVAGKLVTGESFSNIQEMKRVLATDRLNDFYYCFAEKMLTYALGRGVEYYDAVTIDQLVGVLQQNEGRPQELIKAIISSTPFQKRRHPEYETD